MIIHTSRSCSAHRASFKHVLSPGLGTRQACQVTHREFVLQPISHNVQLLAKVTTSCIHFMQRNTILIHQPYLSGSTKVSVCLQSYISI